VRRRFAAARRATDCLAADDAVLASRAPAEAVFLVGAPCLLGTVVRAAVTVPGAVFDAVDVR
jgi:hypothetical protein